MATTRLLSSPTKTAPGLDLSRFDIETSVTISAAAPSKLSPGPLRRLLANIAGIIGGSGTNSYVFKNGLPSRARSAAPVRPS
jgi:hypothetical protein